MESRLVLGGRFRVFEDGRINRVSYGIEKPASVSFASRDYRYGVVSYTEGGEQKKAYVHRLIAAAFIPNPNKYPQVNHKDGNPRNNAVQNLEWVTPSMNVQHAYDTGLLNPMATAAPCMYCGTFTKAADEICPKCKDRLKVEAHKIDRLADQADRYSVIDLDLLTDVQKKYVMCAAEGMNASEIAKRFSVSRQRVDAALHCAEKKNEAAKILQMRGGEINAQNQTI